MKTLSARKIMGTVLLTGTYAANASGITVTFSGSVFGF